MKENIVFGMIASAALATTVLTGTYAQAGGVSQGVERVAQAGDVMPRRGPPVATAPQRAAPRVNYGPGPRPGFRPGPGPRPGFGPGPRPGFGPGYRGPRYYGGGGYWRRGGGYYYDNGAAAALGILGGLAIGGAIAASPGPSRGYDCYIEPRRYWVEGWGWRVREVEVCP